MSEPVFTDTPSDRFVLMCLQAKLGVLADGHVGPMTLQALLREHGEEMTLKELHQELRAFHQSGNPSRALVAFYWQLQREKLVGMADKIECLAYDMAELIRERG